MCVCVRVHVHVCVFTFISPSVCAWKCVPRIVCVYKQMDEKLRLSLSPSLRLSLFSHSMNSGPSFARRSKTCLWLPNTRQESNSVHPILLERVSVAWLPPYLEFLSLAPIITIRFVNWDDVQLSEVATVDVFFPPSLLPFLPVWFCFAYYPRHGKESVQNTEGSSSNKLKSFVCLFK